MDKTQIPFRFTSPTELLKVFPNAECCDCGAGPDGAREDIPWGIYHGDIIYCPQCRNREGWHYP
jgi:hypothetical protein